MLRLQNTRKKSKDTKKLAHKTRKKSHQILYSTKTESKLTSCQISMCVYEWVNIIKMYTSYTLDRWGVCVCIYYVQSRLVSGDLNTRYYKHYTNILMKIFGLHAKIKTKIILPIQRMQHTYHLTTKINSYLTYTDTHKRKKN